MIRQKLRGLRWLGSLGLGGLSLGLLMGKEIAMPMVQSLTPSPFHRLEQPLELKIAVTLAGLGLIGLELWWFLGHKSPKRPNPKNPP